MLVPGKPPNEAARIHALEALQILDTGAEEELDHLARAAADLFDAPIGLISLVDAERQWFKARCGLDVQETERTVSFCAHAILGDDDLFIVSDAKGDPRFSDNALVQGPPYVGGYVGAKLVTVDGHALGTLCVIDHEPIQAEPARLKALLVLRDQAMRHLALRRRALSAEEAKDDAGLRISVARDHLGNLLHDRGSAVFGSGSPTQVRRRIQDEITHLQQLLDEWERPLFDEGQPPKRP